MNYLVVTDTYGKITETAVGPAYALEIQPVPAGCTAYILGDTPPGEATHFDGTYFSCNPKPSPAHEYIEGVWVFNPEIAGEIIKTKRNKLLLDSDWTQLPDVPLVTKEAWALYRQSLRDIPAQAGYPGDVVWPVQP